MNISKPPLQAPCIAVFGTGSDVGKSIVCTALCRIFAQAGIKVAPFKAQNMSNNSWVTEGGGEMGRAQVVQAEAARIAPHVDMNPVLLKPSADTGSQIVLQGSVFGTCTSMDYWNDKEFLFMRAFESLSRLRSLYDLVVIEGAGSCAEVNLRDRDFVNFRIAHAADAAVILVADIDRGGVFAQIVGTLAVLPEDDRERIKGIIINRFRGDSELFKDGIAYIEEKTGIPVLGLVPYFYHIEIESEDGVILDSLLKTGQPPSCNTASIAVLKVPHISNFTDFNVLQRDAAVTLEYLYHPASLDRFDCVILPGTKNVRFDIEWLRDRGWEPCLRTFSKKGGILVGICGGYQMLGKSIRDSNGVEGYPGETDGFGFLDIFTELKSDKVLTQVDGRWIETGDSIKGYEIHMGQTVRETGIQPVVHILKRQGAETEYFDGARSFDGRIWGAYIHGIFDEPDFRRSFLCSLGIQPQKIYQDAYEESVADFKNRQYDLLADHYRNHVNMPLLWGITGMTPEKDREEHER